MSPAEILSEVGYACTCKIGLGLRRNSIHELKATLNAHKKSGCSVIIKFSEDPKVLFTYGQRQLHLEMTQSSTERVKVS